MALVVTVLPAWLACSGTPALAQYPIASKKAFSCEDKSAKALAAFVHAKAKCITGCQRRARQGKNPFTDCDPPTFGGETAVCIFDAKGAEGKANLKIVKSCLADCPACYAGGDCSAAADAQVSLNEGLLDGLNPLIYCSTGGNANQNACRERVVDTIGVYARRHLKCYRDCYVSAQKGKVPAATCTPPVPSDPKASACLVAASAKAAEAIDKGCFRPRAEEPPCYDGNTAPNTGADWTLVAQLAFDSTIPVSFCGSPSGAFPE
jgi:hypothetical protein